VVLVYLVLERAQWTPYDAHYLPGLDTPVARVSEPKNYRASAQDPDGVTVLCAELPATVGDATWTRGDDELGALVADDLARQGLPTGPVAAVHVERLARVYPVYHRGFEHDLAAVQAVLDDAQRLLTIGRHGSFAHDNSHHALDQAWAAADALATGSFDRAAWTVARARFAGHVVED
jgi:protoporphyrinogen oxidase